MNGIVFRRKKLKRCTHIWPMQKCHFVFTEIQDLRNISSKMFASILPTLTKMVERLLEAIRAQRWSQTEEIVAPDLRPLFGRARAQLILKAAVVRSVIAQSIASGPRSFTNSCALVANFNGMNTRMVLSWLRDFVKNGVFTVVTMPHTAQPGGRFTFLTSEDF